MDLSSYSEEDIILSAYKAEIDAKEIYLKIAERISNAFLKERISFIAVEEEKHKEFMESLYKRQFPDKQIKAPDKTPVPLPEVRVEGEDVSPVEVFDSVMAAESAAEEFYAAFAKRFETDTEIKKTLLYFAAMERGHYKLFEIEKENLEKYELYDDEWPMMHVGP